MFQCKRGFAKSARNIHVIIITYVSLFPRTNISTAESSKVNGWNIRIMRRLISKVENSTETWKLVSLPFLCALVPSQEFQSTCISLIVRQRKAEVIIPNVWNIEGRAWLDFRDGYNRTEYIRRLNTYLYPSHRHSQEYQREALALQPTCNFEKATLRAYLSDQLK